jgi:SRSO17 transposase
MGWRERGEFYLRGLMLDRKRKSIQPMAARLQHHSEWNAVAVLLTSDEMPTTRQLSILIVLRYVKRSSLPCLGSHVK